MLPKYNLQIFPRHLILQTHLIYIILHNTHGELVIEYNLIIIQISFNKFHNNKNEEIKSAAHICCAFFFLSISQ